MASPAPGKFACQGRFSFLPLDTRAMPYKTHSSIFFSRPPTQIPEEPRNLTCGASSARRAAMGETATGRAGTGGPVALVRRQHVGCSASSIAQPVVVLVLGVRAHLVSRNDSLMTKCALTPAPNPRRSRGLGDAYRRRVLQHTPGTQSSFAGAPAFPAARSSDTRARRPWCSNVRPKSPAAKLPSTGGAAGPVFGWPGCP